MLVITVIGIFCAGILTGFCIRNIPVSKRNVVISTETFQYFVERDDELWEIERKERGKLRFISSSLVEDCRRRVNENLPDLYN